jgi:antitoxin VapB
MALSIKNREAERLARELANVTGETITEAVMSAMREQLARKRASASARALEESLRDVHERVARIPVLDNRSPEDMLYDEHGLPK